MDDNRKSPRKGIAIAVAAIGVGLASSWFASQQTANAIAGLREQLIARDDVLVNAFEYEAGLFSGELHYDLTWRPVGDEERAALAALGAMIATDNDELRLTGDLPVRHGPWVGGEHGFAVAGTRLEAPLPDAARALLPQYPGTQPLAVLDLAATWSGKLSGVLRVTDYAGRVVDPDTGERFELDLGGFRAAVEIGDDGQEADVSLQIPRFQLRQGSDPGSDGFMIDGLTWRQSAIALRPGLWTGEAGLSVGTARITASGTSVSINDISLDSATTAGDKTVDSTASFRFGESTIATVTDTTSLAGAELALGLRNIDLDAYADLLAQVSAMTTEEIDPARLQDSVSRILAGSPRFTIDRLSFGLADRNDFTAHLSIGLDAAGDPDQIDPATLIARLEAETGFTLALSGLRAAARLYLAGAGELTGNQAQDDAAIEAMLALPLAMAQQNEWVTVTEDAITTDIRLARGQLERDGKPIAAATDLVGLAGLLAMGMAENVGAADTTVEAQAALAAPGTEVVTAATASGLPDFQAPALTRELALEGGFEPDPQTIDVVAGGGHQTSEMIDGCVGYINAPRPDVAIDYQPAEYVLSFRAESDADTSLVIHAPDGGWYCNDDYPGRGLNPAIEFDAPAAGTYAIWIGSVSGDEAATRLQVSESTLSQ